MAEVTMPRLSDTMSEGSVGRWLKKPGDHVEKDEVIAEIETDKATMELVAFESGTLQKILVEEGKIVPIGEVIGLIGDGPAAADAAPASAKPKGDDGKATESTSTDGRSKAAASSAAQATPARATNGAPAAGGADAGGRTAPASAAGRNGAPAAAAQANGAEAHAPAQPGDAHAQGQRIKASPLARRIAEEHGLNLRDVPGTGPGGRILKANVEEFRRRGGQPSRPTAVPAPAGRAQAPATAVVPALTGEIEPMTRMRRAIARAMTESKPGVPHIYLTAEIDMSEAMKLRAQIIDSGAIDIKLSPNDLIVKAAAKALTKFPLINASYTTTPDGQPAIVRHPQVNVSVAVATEEGLLAPVVHDADKKTLGAIAAEIRELAGRARDGKIKPGDLEGATFQTSNLGMFDITEFVSIVTLPQAASLAIGAVRQTPVVRNGQVVIGEIMNVTLSVDHRVADGALGARFLQELTRLLQAPMSLLL
jgi:pyruvate dehydrogenase E2 component (dihydrolipoamide acetyltransferase)